MSRMAAANLAVDDSVVSEWTRLCGLAAEGEGESSDVLSLLVQGERISLAGVLHASSSAELWASLAGQATAALSPAAAPLAPGAKPSLLPPRPECRLWLARLAGGQCFFIGFTPEGVHPKSKMLYASARDDLRRSLPGAGERLAGDYHSSEVPELSLAAFTSWRRRDATEAMSARELQAADIGRAVNAERAAMPVRAAVSMHKVPFALGAALKAALPAFKAPATSTPAVRWVEVSVGSSSSSGSGSGSAAAAPAGDTLELVSSGPAGGVKALTSTVWQPAATEPRFFLTLPECAPVASSAAAAAAAAAATSAAAAGAEGEGEAAEGGAAAAPAPALHPVLLIYHCPEGAKPKMRMLYSTAKTALQEALAAEGVQVTKTAETRDEDDICTAFTDFALNPVTKHVSGMAIAEASAHVAKAEALEAEAAAAKSPAARFGGRALPGMPMGGMGGMSPAPFRLPGLGEKK